MKDAAMQLRGERMASFPESFVINSEALAVAAVEWVSKTRFRVNGGGYSVLLKPFLTQKRGVVDVDWTFFTVMQLVACQLTMERKYHWLLY
jgi:hypothetical protein